VKFLGACVLLAPVTSGTIKPVLFLSRLGVMNMCCSALHGLTGERLVTSCQMKTTDTWSSN
jgi:hypothetical protein